MISRISCSFRTPALALAALLQMVPLVRQALPALQPSGSLMAIILRWGTGAAAALGSVQAVSGASTVITTPLNQTATNGVALGNTQIRLITAPDQAHYWEATGLPPGLYLSGVVGQTSWKILGTPTSTGVYHVGLTAKDQPSSPAERTATATMVITVVDGGLGGGNSPPVANPQTVSTAEDAARAITLSGTDPDADPLTYAIVNQPAHGTLTGSGPTVSYLPSTNYNGSDSFTFRVNDGTTNSLPATVSITVTAVNDAPVANAQSTSTPENQAKAITLTGSDIEGNPLTFSIVNQPAHGSLSGAPPNVIYSPAANYSGADSFTFKVNDGSLDSTPAIVSLLVSSVNAPPVAHPQTVSATEDTPRTITLTGTDPNGDPLSYTVLTQPSKGTLSGSPPNLTFTPTANLNGADSFTFRVNDGATNSQPATVSINIAAVNDAPAATPQSLTTPEDTALAITLTGTDIEGGSLTYTILSQPSHGSLNGTPPTVNYTPAANYNGSDSFTFKVNDGSLDGPAATVSLAIIPVNDPPVVGNVSASATSGNPVTISPLGSASDPDGDSLTISSVSPTNGSAVIVSGTSIRFTPGSSFVGTAYVGYIVSDGHGGSAPGLATINVVAVPVTQFSVQRGSITLNPQTGLYDQQVTLNNTGSGTAAAVRLKVEGLRAGIVLNNAAGLDAGVPYAQYDAPLDPGNSVVFRLEYYVPDRQPFTNTLTAEAVLPATTSPGTAGAAIDRSFLDRTNPADPRMTIEFTTVPGRVYTIIYTDDMVAWKAATPSLTATATRIQWHDDGPPKTVSKPAGNRFYRVIAH